MTTSWSVDVAFWVFSAGSVVAAWLVFRTDSMVRAAYWLLASFAAVGALMVLLNARFLGLVLVLMMAGEMTIMAVFMVMFMMNPAGLNPMTMVHQHRTARIAGLGAFTGLALVGLVADFPDRPAGVDPEPTAALGRELLGDSMLIFETAGVTLLATMVGAIAIASRRGRYGDADDGSAPPPLEPVPAATAATEAAGAKDTEADGAGGHARMGH
ncbi:MAG: NADH-quinone oxidoreductase subunit J [Actinomycetota bacterium]|nr:NADH-quinone oxidoreductase subunit J [Actinomycetota bacterium]